MEVWLLEQGCYDSCVIVGVFSTAERAMEANPPREGWNRGPASAERSGGWQQLNDHWDNGLDWDDGMVLYSMEIDEDAGVPTEE